MQRVQKVKRKEEVMGELKKWLDQKWVRIGTDGKIKGPCGTSKDKKNPDRCLPAAKARSLSQSQRATTAKKKKREGAKGKTVVKNTKPATVKLLTGGLVEKTWMRRTTDTWYDAIQNIMSLQEYARTKGVIIAPEKKKGGPIKLKGGGLARRKRSTHEVAVL